MIMTALLVKTLNHRFGGYLLITVWVEKNL